MCHCGLKLSFEPEHDFLMETAALRTTREHPASIDERIVDLMAQRLLSSFLIVDFFFTTGLGSTV